MLAGTQCDLSWRLYLKDMRDLAEIYTESSSSEDVYRRVRCDGERGDLHFLWLWASPHFAGLLELQH